MIDLPPGTRIWIAAGFTDMRRGFLGLSTMVETVLKQAPYSGHVFVFRGKRGDLIKVLWFDGDGLCLLQKRLERGRFVWPQATEGTVSLTRAQLSMLLPPQRRRPVVGDPGSKVLIGGSLRVHGNHRWPDKSRSFHRILRRVYGILFAMAETLSPVVADLNSLDREALIALLVAEREKRISSDSEIEHLKLVIAKLQRMLFGKKSEKVAHELEQLELKLEELETCESEVIAARPQSQPTSPKAKSARRPLPEQLPREVHTHLPPEEACPECGGALHKLGEDVAEILERVPATYKVIRHVRVKMACVKCDCIVQAPAPSRPIERGIAGPALLAHVLVAKFCDHLPLYRQSEIFAREGIELDRSTLADWVGHASHLLAPLVDATRKYVLASSKIHADDTPVPVLAPGTGKTKTARLWTYVRDDRPAASDAPAAVWFAYTPDRKGEHPRQHLSNFSGTLQADGYAGFHHLYEGGRIYEAACWAHVRRKFYDIQVATGSAMAAEAVERIGALYAIESDVRGKPPDLRQQVRQSRGRPLADELHDWFNKMLTRLSPKSDTAMAIRYALARWRALTRYLDDGAIEIDNSAAERALRGVALGRKNYLFCGSDAGGHSAAAIYSLIGTAKLNGVEPELYLQRVLEKISDWPISRISELLPWNFSESLTNPA